MSERYVITHRNERGERVLSHANQARFHKGSYAEAYAHLLGILENNSRKTIAEVYGSDALFTFDVRKVECYESGDAKRTIFDGFGGMLKPIKWSGAKGSDPVKWDPAFPTGYPLAALLTKSDSGRTVSTNDHRQLKAETSDALQEWMDEHMLDGCGRYFAVKTRGDRGYVRCGYNTILGSRLILETTADEINEWVAA